jgi:hypothetical protein
VITMIDSPYDHMDIDYYMGVFVVVVVVRVRVESECRPILPGLSPPLCVEATSRWPNWDPPSPLTVKGIREMGDDMSVKLNKYHKPRLIEAIVVCMARIDLLEASDGNVRSDGNSNVRAELRELKAAVFAIMSNAVLTQDTQEVLDRPNVGWDDIHKLARGASWHEEQNPAPPLTAPPTAVKDTPPATARNRNDAPPVGENGTGENDMSKLAKRVKLARSTDLWCLSPFTPVRQEARDKLRKVCPLNLRGEVCTASNYGNKHPKVCLVANHSKGKIPKATCLLWHMRVPFAGNAGNATGRRNGSNHPPGSKGSRAKVAVRCHAGPDLGKGPGPGTGPGTGLDPSRAAHLPDCSHPGRGSKDSVGFCQSTPTVESKNTSQTPL